MISINVLVDAYGILRTDFTKQFQVPNMHFLKIKLLLENKEKYDSFVFGSSRPEKIDPRHIPNGRLLQSDLPDRRAPGTSGKPQVPAQERIS